MARLCSGEVCLCRAAMALFDWLGDMMEVDLVAGDEVSDGVLIWGLTTA